MGQGRSIDLRATAADDLGLARLCSQGEGFLNGGDGAFDAGVEFMLPGEHKRSMAGAKPAAHFFKGASSEQQPLVLGVLAEVRDIKRQMPGDAVFVGQQTVLVDGGDEREQGLHADNTSWS